jgi:hypothetical protein
MHVSPPTQDENQAQDDEDQEDEPPLEEDNDQGGDQVNKDKEDDQKYRVKNRHTQESIKRFKEITPSTPFLVIFIRG